MLSRQLIKDLFLLFLGRPPENEDVITDRISSCKTTDEVIYSLITSDEFIWKWRHELRHPAQFSHTSMHLLNGMIKQ